jgi:hypothetical protein
MNELLAKLTNLSYEFFGVILPGLVGSLFIYLWWSALGPLPPLWTNGTIPEMTLETTQGIIDSLSVAVGVGITIPSLAVSYFIGHILLWIARSGSSDQEATKKWWRRVWLSLTFRIPKPPSSYDIRLEKLYKAVQAKFAIDGALLEWREFYPIVKSYLSQRLMYSLISTYQNKYTFHRSITTASAVLFWFCWLAFIGGMITYCITGIAPHWGLITALLVGSILLVWGFSSSYMYHWEMFGNTIITEAYSLIYGPKEQQLENRP